MRALASIFFGMILLAALAVGGVYLWGKTQFEAAGPVAAEGVDIQGPL